jgi:hypothetical protein
LLMPVASIVSTESTVTELFMPDTVRLVQWPPIVIALETPLIVTTLFWQTIVLVSLTPEMLMLLEGGAVAVPEGPVVGVGVRLADGVGLLGVLLVEPGVREVVEVLGVGEKVAVLPWEARCAASATIPPTTASINMTAIATTIQITRGPEGGRFVAYGSP